MDYGEIITRAWTITWNNKFLWILGFLVALTSAGSNGNSFQSTFDNSDFANNPELVTQLGAMAAGLACVGLIIGLVFCQIIKSLGYEKKVSLPSSFHQGGIHQPRPDRAVLDPPVDPFVYPIDSSRREVNGAHGETRLNHLPSLLFSEFSASFGYTHSHGDVHDDHTQGNG